MRRHSSVTLQALAASPAEPDRANAALTTIQPIQAVQTTLMTHDDERELSAQWGCPALGLASCGIVPEWTNVRH
jgi:hypothetical protein